MLRHECLDLSFFNLLNVSRERRRRFVAPIVRLLRVDPRIVYIRATTYSALAFCIRVYAAEPRRTRFDPKSFRIVWNWATPPGGCEGLVRKRRKVKGHAVNSTPGSSGRGGCPAVASKSLHSHAEIHQVNFERRRGDCCSPVATECFWTFSFSFPNTRWNVKDDEISRDVNALNPRSIQRNLADICLKEIL